jgi:hypothetical protein
MKDNKSKWVLLALSGIVVIVAIVAARACYCSGIGGEIILSGVIAISTFAYAIINIFMLIENQKIREIKSTPLIVAFLKSTEDHSAFRLYIKNVGEGVAKDVKVKILNDYKTFGLENRMLSNLGIMKYELNILPPQEQLMYFVDSWGRFGKQEDYENQYINISIDYTGLDGKKKHNNTYNLLPIQLSDQGLGNPPETYIGRIAYFIEKISKDINGSIERNI